MAVDDFYACFAIRLNKTNDYVTAVIKIAGHIASIGSIYNLFLIDVSSIESKHITAEMKLGLPDISQGLTDDFPNILDHDGVFGAEMSCE